MLTLMDLPTVSILLRNRAPGLPEYSCSDTVGSALTTMWPAVMENFNGPQFLIERGRSLGLPSPTTAQHLDLIRKYPTGVQGRTNWRANQPEGTDEDYLDRSFVSRRRAVGCSGLARGIGCRCGRSRPRVNKLEKEDSSILDPVEVKIGLTLL